MCTYTRENYVLKGFPIELGMPEYDVMTRRDVDEMLDITISILNKYMDAATVDKFKFKILAMGCNEGKHWTAQDDMDILLESELVTSLHGLDDTNAPWWRAWISHNPGFMSEYSTFKIDPDMLLRFERKIPDFIKYVERELKNIVCFEQYSYPVDVVKTAKELESYIEGVTSMDSAFDFLIRRTCGNTRCQYYNNDLVHSKIGSLVAYAKDMQWSVKDFKSFARKSGRYIRRVPKYAYEWELKRREELNL